MELLKRYSALKYVIVCLLSLMALNADVWSYDTPSDGPQPAYEVAVLDMADSGSSLSAPHQECNLPRQTRLANTLRTLSQAGRICSANPLRSCAATVKGEVLNHCHSLLQHLSVDRSPLGVMESHHLFISLGKLII